MNKCFNCGKNQGVYQIKTKETEFLLCDNCLKELESKPQKMNELMKKKKQNQQENAALTDLTDEMQDSQEYIMHRDEELNRIVQILSRKNKNNPVLIGEPGTGKTAVVEHLAQKIANDDIDRFKGYKVKSFNIASFMSETKLRGELENKFNELMKDIDDKTILFIDEIHMIMGAGASTDGNIDISNLLKPYMARGDIKVIGSTTLDEFRKIEKDSAFNRRMQPVHIDPLTNEQTKTLLHSVKSSYEKFHNVEISDEVTNLMVDMSDEYIKTRYQPDKAIDLLDETASMVSVRDKAIAIKEENQEIESMKNQTENFFNRFGKDVSSQVNAIIKEFDNIQTKPVVTDEDVHQVIEKISGIPVSIINNDRKEKIRHLEHNLKQSVIGQNEAVSSLAKTVKRSLVKIKKRNRPTVLFFAGPTGVGKTESAKSLAQSLFGDKESLVRFDMSEYMESHSVSKMIGTPPGYVGYDEEGQLSETIRRKPYSVILLDEFEKAHDQISRLFLQVFDDGHLTDAKGREIDFSNTIIILTSNIGTTEPNPLGFGAKDVKEDNKTMSALESMYPPEFLNRLDEVITFNELTKDDLMEIAELKIQEYQEEVKAFGVDLHLNQEVKERLVDEGYSPSLGARPLERAITTKLEDLLVDVFLEKDDKNQLETINLTLENNEITVTN